MVMKKKKGGHEHHLGTLTQHLPVITDQTQPRTQYLVPFTSLTAHHSTRHGGLVGAHQYGSSAWGLTAESGGDYLDFPLKVRLIKQSCSELVRFSSKVRGTEVEPKVKSDRVKIMERYDAVPSVLPQPRGYGKCLELKDFDFFCGFKMIDHRVPG